MNLGSCEHGEVRSACDGVCLTMSSASVECTVLSSVPLGDLEAALFSSSW